MIRKFRKKPVVIEAMHFTTDNDDGTCINSITSWIACNGSPARNDKTNIYIMTLEGEMCASCGDWIIKGVKGEFYPCKADIFEATYEEVKSD